MSTPTIDHAPEWPTGSSHQPPVTLCSTVLLVSGNARPAAYRNHSVGGIQLHVGGDHFDPTLVLAAAEPADMFRFLEAAREAVLGVAPDADPEPGPDHRLVQMRQALVEDLLPRLGVPTAGMTTEIPEITQADVRAARRSAQLVLAWLEGVLSEFS